MKTKGIYNIEELIDNSDFVDYVLGRSSTDVSEFWATYQSQYPEQRSTLEEAQKVIQHLASEEEHVDKHTLAEVRGNLEALLQSEKKKKGPIRKIWALAAAACFGLLFMFNMLWFNNKITIATASGEHKSHILPDGSVVSLNADSKITYDKSSFNQDDRKLSLEGQAFFNVEKGIPFIVTTDVGKVEVLGTSFDVYDREKLLLVACKTGKVRVSGDKESTILLPGDEVRLSNNKLHKSKRNIDEIGAWETGTFYFDSIKLRSVLNEVERQFNTKVITNPTDLGEQPYTGYFVQGHIDSALTSVCWPLRLTFEHGANSIEVSKN